MNKNFLKYFYLRYIKRINTPKKLIRFAAKRHKLKIIFEQDGIEISASDLDQRANMLANGLLNKGLKKGDKLGVLIPNCTEFIELRLAAYKAGFVFCALIDDFTKDQISDKLEELELDAFVFDKHAYNSLSKLPKDKLPQLLISFEEGCDLENLKTLTKIRDGENTSEPKVKVLPGDICAIGFTSGTTGTSKGVVWNNQAWITSFYHFLLNATPVSGEMVLLQFLPLSTAASLSLLPWLASGGKMLLMKEYDPSEIARIITERKVSHLTMAPTFLIDLWDFLQHQFNRYNLSSLRSISVGSSALPNEKLKKLINYFGPIITQSYGMAENLAPLSSIRIIDISKEKKLIASVGKPIKQVRIKLDKPKDLNSGRLLIRSKTSALGYWSKTGYKTSCFKGNWYVSDDIGAFNENGYLFLKERISNVFECNGNAIYPRQIEETVHRYKGIKEVCICERDNKIVGYISLCRGSEIDVSDLMDFCRNKLNKEQVPTNFIILKHLPRSSSGKTIALNLPY